MADPNRAVSHIAATALNNFIIKIRKFAASARPHDLIQARRFLLGFLLAAATIPQSSQAQDISQSTVVSSGSTTSSPDYSSGARIGGGDRGLSL